MTTGMTTVTTKHDLGLLALRAGLGGALVGHGTQKLLGWFGGGGVEGTAGFMSSQGFAPGKPHAVMAGLTEAGGGAALVLGLATGPAAGAVVGTMVVAGSTQASKGFFATSGGFELTYVYGLAAAALALTGPGRASLDRVTGNALNRGWMTAVAFVGAAGSAAVLIARSRRTRAEQEAAA